MHFRIFTRQKKILESTLAMIFSQNCQFHTEKSKILSRNSLLLSEVISGQMHFHSFLYIFSKFFLFQPFSGISQVFLPISPSLFPSLFPSFFQVFSKYSKSKFFLRCGNSVDFLYGGLIVRVSSCLSAFRSFALHTFFKSRDSI